MDQHEAESKGGGGADFCRLCLRHYGDRCPEVGRCMLCSSLSYLTNRALVDLLEKVVTLIVNQNEGGEVLNLYFPHGFHT